MNYDLSKDVKEGVEFEVNKNSYYLRFPTTEEIEASSKNIDLPEEERDKAFSDWMFTLVETRTEGAPDIREVLQKSNIGVLKNFNKMVKAELFDETVEG